MKADLLTRLRQWGDKPNEGDPIIDAMAGDLAEAAECIAGLNGCKVKLGDDRDRYRAALERITKLKSKPIGETGFAIGPLTLLHQAQRVAREAIGRRKSR